MRRFEGLQSLFLRAYASVPDKLRNEIIAIIDGKTYSWNAAFIEISANTKLGEKILARLDEIKLF